MRRDARILKRKAIASLRRAAAGFNSLEDEARHTTVLLHLQHAFEMLLKAGLHQKRVPVVDGHSGQSIGFKKCLNHAPQHLGMTDADIGTLRAIDRLRDDEYHYLGLVSEGILFVHLRAAISIFDRVLRDQFGETLADHMPARVLPISTQPPQSLDVLIDEEFSQVRALLTPGRRQGVTARARIRTLLALESHAVDGVEVTEGDVNRVEAAIRRGEARDTVFPRLSGLSSKSTGLEVTIKVQTTKRDGMPVRFVPAGDDQDAAAVRDVDLQKKFHFGRLELAKHAGLTAPKAAALRAHLGIDADENAHHTFTFGHSVHEGYSDVALKRMRDELAAGLDMDEVWRQRTKRAAATRKA
jgi:hypothetical protein